MITEQWRVADHVVWDWELWPVHDWDLALKQLDVIVLGVSGFALTTHGAAPGNVSVPYRPSDSKILRAARVARARSRSSPTPHQV